MKIVLASQSTCRLEILRQVMPEELPVVAFPTYFDEQSIRRPPSPVGLTTKLALKKLEILRERVKEEAVLVGADTVAVYHGEIREKPRTKEEARGWLRSYNYRPARVVTSVALYHTWTGAETSFVDSATVWFEGLTDAVIDELLDEGLVLGCAGAFTMQHPVLGPHVRRLIGDMTTVQGLPAVRTRAAVMRLLA